jgi:hypothetical protein
MMPEYKPEARNGAGLVIDRRACQRTRARQRLKETADDIPDTFGEALSVIVERLAGVRGNRFGDRERFEDAQKSNRERSFAKRWEPLQVDLGKVKRPSCR